MKKYIDDGDKYYSVECEECGSYMKNEFTFRDMVIWVCPECNHTITLDRITVRWV